MGHPTDGVFNVASSRQVHFISELWRQTFQSLYQYIFTRFLLDLPVHKQRTIALWRESFYVEFYISREILLILEKPYSGQGYVTNYAVLVAKIDLF